MLRLVIHNCLQVPLPAACFWPLEWGYRGWPGHAHPTRKNPPKCGRETFTTVVIQDPRLSLFARLGERESKSEERLLLPL
jgi:hypothetical protein